jgi:hypothetical protein
MYLVNVIRIMSITHRMEMACTAWVECLNTPNDDRGYCQKHETLSLHDILSDGRYFLDVSFITSLK